MPLQMLETCKGPGTSSTNMRSGLIRLRRGEVGVCILSAIQGLRMRASYDLISTKAAIFHWEQQCRYGVRWSGHTNALSAGMTAAIGTCDPTRSVNAGRRRDCIRFKGC